MNRRDFVKTASGVTAAAFVAPLFSIGRAGIPANSRLNVAMIGAGNIASMAYAGTPNENWVALCDVDSTYLDEAKATHANAANARTFRDFREMFDKMGGEIDAVCISTPDHTHFAATLWAMQHDCHVCTQKPLTRTVWESRALLQAASEKPHLITNMANQGHTYDGIRQAREWIEHGLIGEVKTVHSFESGPKWGNRWFQKPPSFPPPFEAIPETLEWDLWLGPLYPREFSSYYHPLKWRSFWDLGTGMLGDWFCHTCDGPVWSLGLYQPEYVELIGKDGDNGLTFIPDRSIVKWHFPARANHPACDLFWYDGGLRPQRPEKWSWGPVPARGSYFEGSENTLFLDERSNNPRLVNREEMIAFSRNGQPAERYERTVEKDPFKEWVAAIKGKGPLPGSRFEYAARLTEVALLGVLAQRFGGRLDWDAAQGRITNRPELNAFLREPCRRDWIIGETYPMQLDDSLRQPTL